VSLCVFRRRFIVVTVVFVVNVAVTSTAVARSVAQHTGKWSRIVLSSSAFRVTTAGIAAAKRDKPQVNKSTELRVFWLRKKVEFCIL
jgi:hypothetical protein